MIASPKDKTESIRAAYTKMSGDEREEFDAVLKQADDALKAWAQRAQAQAHEGH